MPFYGQNHARQHKTDKSCSTRRRTGWYHDLNRDPRTRVPAGFGTAVVQKNQEKFMQRAWQQVQKVYEANRKIREFQFLLQVSTRLHAQFFATLRTRQSCWPSLAVHAKVLGSPTTIRHQLEREPPGGAGLQRALPPPRRDPPGSWRGASAQGRGSSIRRPRRRRSTRTVDTGAAARRARGHSVGRRPCRGAFSRRLPDWLAWLIDTATCAARRCSCSLLLLGHASRGLASSPARWRVAAPSRASVADACERDGLGDGREPDRSSARTAAASRARRHGRTST